MSCEVCKIECRRYGKHRSGLERFRCPQCGKTYTEAHERLFTPMILHEEKALLAIQLLIEGTSILAYTVGKRNRESTYQFLTDLRSRIAPEHRFQLTTDGFHFYRRGVEDVFTGQSDFAPNVESCVAIFCRWVLLASWLHPPCRLGSGAVIIRLFSINFGSPRPVKSSLIAFGFGRNRCSYLWQE